MMRALNEISVTAKAYLPLLDARDLFQRATLDKMCFIKISCLFGTLGFVICVYLALTWGAR